MPYKIWIKYPMLFKWRSSFSTYLVSILSTRSAGSRDSARCGETREYVELYIDLSEIFQVNISFLMTNILLIFKRWHFQAVNIKSRFFYANKVRVWISAPTSKCKYYYWLRENTSNIFWIARYSFLFYATHYFASKFDF